MDAVPETLGLPPVVEAVRCRVDQALAERLATRREEISALDPAAAVLVDELGRLLAAGGKRLRPAFCYLGFRASGGRDDEPIVWAAAALELLHSFALIHDDVMDGATLRRGSETTGVRFAREEGSERVGSAVAILVGDLAGVLAESLLRSSGFAADRLAVALDRFDRMRIAMAAGQYLDLVGVARGDLAAAERVAELKTASYTVEGPLLIGAALAGATAEVEERLSAYGRPAGEAFQLRDDVTDGEALPGAAGRVGALVDEALAALDGVHLDPVAASALRALAGALRLPGG
jgi:geranylgeranyl diphosphate synthase, type I